MKFFLDWCNRQTQIAPVLKAGLAHFWFVTIHPFDDGNGCIVHITLNERQKKLINLLLDGCVGKLTTSKWAKIAKCSQDTAYRDILGLVDFGVLNKSSEAGRSTSYFFRKR